MLIRIAAASIILATASIAGASYGDDYQFPTTRKLEHLIPERVPVPQRKPPVPYQPVHLSRLVSAMPNIRVNYSPDIRLKTHARKAALEVSQRALQVGK